MQTTRHAGYPAVNLDFSTITNVDAAYQGQEQICVMTSGLQLTTLFAIILVSLCKLTLSMASASERK